MRQKLIVIDLLCRCQLLQMLLCEIDQRGKNNFGGFAGGIKVTVPNRCVDFGIGVTLNIL